MAPLLDLSTTTHAHGAQRHCRNVVRQVRLVSGDELNAAVATFASAMAAKAAADAAMPRRRHNRPYPQISGWHWARSVRCPACGADAGVDCPERLHRERESSARSMGAAANRWIVCAYPNIVLLRDGSMYDHQRKVTVRP